jgi:hypothetical protein
MCGPGRQEREEILMASKLERGVPGRCGEFLALELVGRVVSGDVKKISFTQSIIVASDEETLSYLQNHMDSVITNVVRVKKMEQIHHEKTGHYHYERKIESLLSSMPVAPDRRLMGDLSASLKKALLLISLDRFHGNRELVCKMLGISRRELDKEMQLCGITSFEQSGGERRR